MLWEPSGRPSLTRCSCRVARLLFSLGPFCGERNAQSNCPHSRSQMRDDTRARRLLFERDELASAAEDRKPLPFPSRQRLIARFLSLQRTLTGRKAGEHAPREIQGFGREPRAPMIFCCLRRRLSPANQACAPCHKAIRSYRETPDGAEQRILAGDVPPGTFRHAVSGPVTILPTGTVNGRRLDIFIGSGAAGRVTFTSL